METYYQDGAARYTEILQFIGVPSIGEGGFKDEKHLSRAALVHRNSAHPSKVSKEEVTDALRLRLGRIYQKPNCELDDLLGRKMGYCNETNH